MSHDRQPPAQIPVLTEVIGGLDSSDAAVAKAEPVSSEELIAQRVLVDLQRQVDLMFEYRLRETLAPALNRLADGLVREIRNELATTLRDVVKRAVAQELARQRGR
ncbi:MAG: hypothetical protein RJA44_1620 [Pseudomonadota bacterium]